MADVPLTLCVSRNYGAAMNGTLNIVDQWMDLLGFERQADFADAIGRSKFRPSQWRRDNAIPAAAILDLHRLARARGVAVPDQMLRRTRPPLMATPSEHAGG